MKTRIKTKMKVSLIALVVVMNLCSMLSNAASPSVFTYKVHVSELGDLPVCYDGERAGTTGKNLALEEITLKLTYGEKSGIAIMVHLAELGWSKWYHSGEAAGTRGRCIAIEAVRIKLENGLEKLYDVYYRTHVEDTGDMGWAKNGEISGSVGYAKQIESIEICIIAKRDGRSQFASNMPASRIKNDTGIVDWQYPMTSAYCTWPNKTNMSWSGYSYSSTRPSRTDHSGIDIASAVGDTNVYAAASGKVARVGYNSANGNYVVIQYTLNGKTVYSFYAHLRSYCVSGGTSVDAGDRIGIIGNTGSASRGTHLHFAVVNRLEAGSYCGYVPSFNANKASYGGITYYNPVYIIEHNSLP